MKVYEADVSGYVAGVAPLETESCRQLQRRYGDRCRAWQTTRYLKEPSARLCNYHIQYLKELDVGRLLLPYDPTYPDHPIPSKLTGAAVAQARYFIGCRMTFRAEVIRSVGFDETLRRYASGEDLDASYRASRHGVLLNAINALISHAQDRSARLSRHTRTLLGLLNLAYLYRRKGHDPARLLSTYRWRVLRRFLVDVLRDAGRSRLSLPCARADLEALIRLTEIGHIPAERIVEWYATLQERIIERNAA